MPVERAVDQLPTMRLRHPQGHFRRAVGQPSRPAQVDRSSPALAVRRVGRARMPHAGTVSWPWTARMQLTVMRFLRPAVVFVRSVREWPYLPRQMN